MAKYVWMKYCDLYNTKDMLDVVRVVQAKDSVGCEKELSKVKFISKSTMLFNAILFALTGGNRAVLGDRKIARAKFVVFSYIIVSLISILIAASVQFSANVGVMIPNKIYYASDYVGTAVEHSLYLFGALLGAYVLYAIIDTFLCYNKAKKINYYRAMNAISDVGNVA